MQSISSEIHDFLRIDERSKGNKGKEPMKTTVDELKLAKKKDKGSKTE